MKQPAYQTTNRTLWLAGIVAILALFAMGMFTRIGVHTVFSALGIGAESTHWRGEPNSPPMVPDARLERAASMPLPRKILQPSGIAWDDTHQRFLIVTDQAELFALSSDLAELQSSVLTRRLPLLMRQGSVETVSVVDAGVFVGGTGKDLAIWSDHKGIWSKEEKITINRLEGSGDVMASAVAPTGIVFFAVDGVGLFRVNLSGETAAERLPLTGVPTIGRSISEYEIVGLDYAQGYLYALVQHYPNLLQIQPSSGCIVRVYHLESLDKGAGLSVRDGVAFVVQDHEYNEPSPGVATYRLSMADSATKRCR